MDKTEKLALGKKKVGPLFGIIIYLFIYYYLYLSYSYASIRQKPPRPQEVPPSPHWPVSLPTHQLEYM